MVAELAEVDDAAIEKEKTDTFETLPLCDLLLYINFGADIQSELIFFSEFLTFFLH